MAGPSGVLLFLASGSHSECVNQAAGSSGDSPARLAQLRVPPSFGQLGTPGGRVPLTNATLLWRDSASVTNTCHPNATDRAWNRASGLSSLCEVGPAWAPDMMGLCNWGGLQVFLPHRSSITRLADAPDTGSTQNGTAVVSWKACRCCLQVTSSIELEEKMVLKVQVQPALHNTGRGRG